MTAEFLTAVQQIVGPLLGNLGFVLDEVDDCPDEGEKVNISSTTSPKIARCKSTSHHERVQPIA